MNKIYLLALVSLLSVGSVASPSYASNSGEKSGFVISNSGDLVGLWVKDPHGKFLGLIAEVLTDNRGHAEFAVIKYGGDDIYGFTWGLTPVPIAALNISKTKSGRLTIVLNSTEKKLEAAPFLDPKRIGNPQYQADVYRYYGIQPYWTEDGKSAK